MARGWEKFEVYPRNMDIKGESGEVSHGNEDMLLEIERKAILFIVPWNMAELCVSVLRKVELVSDEIGYLAEDISKCWKSSLVFADHSK